MAVRIQVPEKASFARVLLSPWGRAVIIAFLVIGLTGLLTFTLYYNRYSSLIEQKLAPGPMRRPPCCLPHRRW